MDIRKIDIRTQNELDGFHKSISFAMHNPNSISGKSSMQYAESLANSLHRRGRINGYKRESLLEIVELTKRQMNL